MNYKKASRFLTVFGIVYVISLSLMTTLFSDFAYDLFDIYLVGTDSNGISD